MGEASTEKLWATAKKKFEEGAGKKRPGDPVKAGKLAKFITKFKAHTGITPLCKTYDKAMVAADPTNLRKDEKNRDKLVTEFNKAADALRTQLKKYMGILKTEIDKEFEEGDVKRCLENFDNEVEVISKQVKMKQLATEGTVKNLKGEAGPLGNLLPTLLTTHKGMEKAMAGMKVMVRNIKALPSFDNFMKEMTGDPATRWATTSYKALVAIEKKVPGMCEELGFDPKLLEAKLNDYGAGHDSNWWKKKIGAADMTKSVLAFAKAIEDQIPNVERAAAKVKEYSKKYRDK